MFCFGSVTVAMVTRLAEYFFTSLACNKKHKHGPSIKMFRVVKMAEYCQTMVLRAASKWHPVNSSVHPPFLKNPDNII